jgi:hypothetical protein
MKHSVILLIVFLLLGTINVVGIMFIPNYKGTNSDIIVFCTYFIVKAIENHGK